MTSRHRVAVSVLAIATAALSVSVTTTAYAGAPAKPHTTTSVRPAVGDPATVLPSGGPAADMVVDEATSQVFISFPGNNSIVVTNLGGQIQTTLTGVTGAAQMALDPTGGTLYVTEQGQSAIAEIDTSTIGTATLGLTPVALPAGDCPSGIAYTGGAVWFAWGSCVVGSTGLGSIDATSNTASVVANGAGYPSELVALPDRPDRVFAFVPAQSPIDMAVWDVTTATPTKVKAVPGDGDNCPAAALISGGDEVVTACGAPYDFEVFNTADLSADPVIPSGAYPNGVAVSPDGKFLATSLNPTTQDWDIAVSNISGSVPGTAVGSYDLPTAGYSPLLAWNAAGTLFVVEPTSVGPTIDTLHVLAHAEATTEAITMTAPAISASGGTVSGSGALSPALGATATATLSRTDRTGTHALPAVTIVADGTYSFTDKPPSGPVTYTVSYAGDITHSPATASAKTQVRTMPYDIKGNGFADLVVGSPLEDDGSIVNGGMFHVLYSGASGVTGTGSVGYTQDTTGVPGVVEKDDQFGWSQASGDFNGDGYADVAVSSNNEAVGSVKGAGTVTVFYGGPSGLKTTGVQLIQSPNVQSGGFFGETMAVGDFNGDGLDDLAISQAGTNDVYIDYGRTSGLSTTALQDFEQGSNGVPGVNNPGETWGLALSAGDVNGDGDSDLAVGAPFDYDDHGSSDPTGSVTVIYGSVGGLDAAGAQRFTKDTSGVPGTSHTFTTDEPDQFGFQVELADFNGDGKADLAVSAPGAPVTTSDDVKHEDAGTVTVLYSSGTKISTTNSVEVTQATAGMPGNPGKGDGMGLTMAVGDSNGDGKADLAIYSPGDHYVTIVKGSSTGLSYATAVAFTQSSSGITGTDTAGDAWGGSLRFANFKGAGPQGLAVGATGKHNGEGSVSVLYSSSSGLTGTGSTYLDQNSPGVPGTAEAGDEFGAMFSW